MVGWTDRPDGRPPVRRHRQPLLWLAWLTPWLAAALALVGFAAERGWLR